MNGVYIMYPEKYETVKTKILFLGNPGMIRLSAVSWPVRSGSSCTANEILNLEENDYNLFILQCKRNIPWKNDYTLFILQCKRNIPWRKWLHFRIRRHLTVFVHMMSLVTTMTKMKTIDLLNTVWPEPLLCLLWPITLSWLNNDQTIRIQIKMVVVILFMRSILFFWRLLYWLHWCFCFRGQLFEKRCWQL